MGYGVEIAVGAIVGALVGGGSAAARGENDEGIMWNTLGGAALGAATSGAGTAVQALGQGGSAAAQTGSAAAQGATQSAAQGTSGIVGGAAGVGSGAATGAGSAAISSAAQEGTKQTLANMAVEELMKQAPQEGVEVGAGSAAATGAGESAGLSAPNTAGMEMWPSIPQYMNYSKGLGGFANKLDYLAKGAYEYPGVQAGIKGGRYASSLGSIINTMTPPEIPMKMPNIGQQLQGKQYGMDWYKRQQQANAPKPMVGSSLGYGFDPEDPYGTQSRKVQGYWNSRY